MQFDAYAVSPLDSNSFANEVGRATFPNFPTDALRDTVTAQIEAAVRRTVRQERHDLYRRLEDDLDLHSSYAHSRVKEGLPAVTCNGGVKEFLQTEANKWRTHWTSEHTADFKVPQEFRPAFRELHEVSTCEIRRLRDVCRRYSLKKATGSDFWQMKILSLLPDEALAYLLSWFTQVGAHGEWPEWFKLNIMAILGKETGWGSNRG